MTDTPDPTPERRWTLSEYARPYAVFRSPTGGHLSSAYGPDVEALLLALNEAEDLRDENEALHDALRKSAAVVTAQGERVRVLEAHVLAIAKLTSRERPAPGPYHEGQLIADVHRIAGRALAGAETEAGE